LKLLQSKLQGSGTAPAAAVQAFAAAVAKGVVLQQQEQHQHRQSDLGVKGTSAASCKNTRQQELCSISGAHGGADRGPSTDALWIVERVEATVRAAEDRLHMSISRLVERLDALEARLMPASQSN
jgi:hypothetical protein